MLRNNQPIDERKFFLAKKKKTYTYINACIIRRNFD